MDCSSCCKENISAPLILFPCVRSQFSTRLQYCFLLYDDRYNVTEFKAVPSPDSIVAFRNARVVETSTHVFTYEAFFLANVHLRGVEEVESTTIERILSVVTPNTLHAEPDLEERFALDDWHKLNHDLKLISILNDCRPRASL
jgi:hypothetical protein